VVKVVCGNFSIALLTP
ncbi:DUF3265 domain-containing protein, partial [Vibrio vulnificus]|nr:DUF3265 domain-containing protein [Vibrio vulnificus]